MLSRDRHQSRVPYCMQTSHYLLRGPNLNDPSVDRLAYRRTARQHVRSGSGEHTRYPPHFLFVTSLCLNNNNIGGKISMSPPLSHGLAGCLHIAWRRPSGATRDRHITRYRGSTYTFQQRIDKMTSNVTFRPSSSKCHTSLPLGRLSTF